MVSGLKKRHHHYLQKLLTMQKSGLCLQSNLIFISAKMAGIALEEVVVTNEKSPMGSFPMLQIDDNTSLCDSHAILSYLLDKSSLAGKSDFEKAQVDQWMDFIRADLMPLVQAIQWMTFGHRDCSTQQYN